MTRATWMVQLGLGHANAGLPEIVVSRTRDDAVALYTVAPVPCWAAEPSKSKETS